MKEGVEKVDGAEGSGKGEEEEDEDQVASEEKTNVLSPISVEYEPLGVHR